MSAAALELEACWHSQPRHEKNDAVSFANRYRLLLAKEPGNADESQKRQPCTYFSGGEYLSPGGFPGRRVCRQCGNTFHRRDTAGDSGIKVFVLTRWGRRLYSRRYGQDSTYQRSMSCCSTSRSGYCCSTSLIKCMTSSIVGTTSRRGTAKS